MRTLLFITFSIIGTLSFAQVSKIKIKKQEALYKVTLSGIDSGFASLDQIIKAKKLIVNNPKDALKIYSYMAFIDHIDVEQNTGVAIQGTNNTLSDELIKALEKNPIKLAIRNILAFNSFNETIQLNDIVITFIDGP